MGWGKLRKFVKKTAAKVDPTSKAGLKNLGGVVAGVVAPVTLIPGVRQVAKKLDVTDSSSSLRAGLRATDKAVGGGQGWGQLTQIAGSVVAVIPGGQAIGAGMIVAGKGLQKGAASADAKRDQRNAVAAQQAAVQQQTQQMITAGGSAGAAVTGAAGGAVVVGNGAPGVLARIAAWFHARGW